MHLFFFFLSFLFWFSGFFVSYATKQSIKSYRLRKGHCSKEPGKEQAPECWALILTKRLVKGTVIMIVPHTAMLSIRQGYPPQLPLLCIFRFLCSRLSLNTRKQPDFRCYFRWLAWPKPKYVCVGFFCLFFVFACTSGLGTDFTFATYYHPLTTTRVVVEMVFLGALKGR